MEKKRAEFIITGFVQGVGFRYYAMKRAIELGLTGYAKNRYNGDVEAVAEGSEQALEAFHGKLAIGPSRARVTSVSVSYSNYTGAFEEFDIR
jgi:acylphosphatase